MGDGVKTVNSPMAYRDRKERTGYYQTAIGRKHDKIESAKSISELTRYRIPYFQEYYDLLRYEVDPLGGFRLCRNQHLPHVTVNQNGFRGKPFNGTETILMLGDSVTFGVGASGDEACFSRFLETRVGQPVADSSVRAYRVCQQFAQLPRLFTVLPRVCHVVLWCGFADLLFWATTGGCVEGAFQFERKYAIPPKGIQSSRVLNRIFSLVRAAERRLIRAKSDVESRAREYGSLSDLVRHMVMYIGVIRDLCLARKINLHVLVQPFIRTRPSDVELRTITDFYNERIRSKCGVSWYEAAPNFVEELVTTLVQHEGIDTIDCQSFVSETDFLDQVHLQEKSLELLARKLVEFYEFCHVPAVKGQARLGIVFGQQEAK